eukprot:jgi/Mesvir1/11600/Mv00011-RA.1
MVGTKGESEGVALSSFFGWRKLGGVLRHHNGIDVAAKEGTPILAAGPGTVTSCRSRGAYGNFVEITHDGGFTTRYGHASKLYTKVGKRVRAGTPIAAVGSTGSATGPHLHFEIRKNGVPLNPCAYGVATGLALNLGA